MSSASDSPALQIGVFDSGLGGLWVLRALRARLPSAAFHYVADSGHAPYGEREDTHALERSVLIVDHLMNEGADLIVIACNTATAIAAKALRARWPHVPIIGIEPGLKPAAAATRNGRIGVMATRNTLASRKFAALLAEQPEPERFHLQACDGLAAAIETGRLADANVLALVARHAEPLQRGGVDTVVLGCTHYASVRRHIQDVFGPAVQIIDTAEAVARHAAHLAAEISPRARPSSAIVRMQTTGDTELLQRLAKVWLDLDAPASPMPAAIAR